jgi:hypothetical protein
MSNHCTTTTMVDILYYFLKLKVVSLDLDLDPSTLSTTTSIYIIRYPSKFTQLSGQSHRDYLGVISVTKWLTFSRTSNYY